MPDVGLRVSAVSRGKLAVAGVLRRDYLTQYETTDDETVWLPLATEAIDAWLIASNPVGEPETIYDEFYRLREAARELVAADATLHRQCPPAPEDDRLVAEAAQEPPERKVICEECGEIIETEPIGGTEDRHPELGNADLIAPASECGLCVFAEIGGD